MAQENIDAVKALFVAFADRDLDAAGSVLDPDVEIRPAIVGGPEGVVYRGLSGNSQFWADIDAAWAEFRAIPELQRPTSGPRGRRARGGSGDGVAAGVR